MKKSFISKVVVLWLVLGFGTLSHSQSELTEKPAEASILSFEEYMAYVKKYHPLVKMADLNLSVGEAEVLKARGAFDPKVEVDYERKKFNGTTYYDQLNSTFKIPTWFGLEFKAKYEDNSGAYLDPSLTVPEDGIYSAGVELDLTNGFLINQRMASLRKAQLFEQESKATRDLMINEVLFEATKAYLNWCQAYNSQLIYENFLDNAALRYEGVKRSVEVGDKAEIDATEALITLESRQLSLENASLESRKNQLLASNFLWLENVPLEIQQNIVPAVPTTTDLSQTLSIENLNQLDSISDNHPKLLALDYKIQQLEIDKDLKQSKLLPKMSLSYDFLTTDYERINSLNTGNYKAGFNLSFPLFLRSERGDIKLANLKLADTNYDLLQSRLEIRNKLQQTSMEFESLQTQYNLIDSMVKNNQTMVRGEERKFEIGE
ncbi:TolC family protein, partial [Aegicerativicinus sediminis]